MTTVAPRAFSYVRFSTPDQIKGDSLRRQVELSVRYAKEHGLALDEKLTFRDLGVSAFDKSNLGAGGKLREFLDAVDQGIVPPGSFLLVESLDRLSRAQIYDALRVFLDILGKGITIVTLADGMRYGGKSDDQNKDFTSLVVSLAVMARAHEESLTKSQRLKAAWGAKRQVIGEKKLTSQCPAWLQLNKDKTDFEFVPEKVAVVRQIIDLVRSGQGKAAIARRFNERSVPSIGNRKNGQTWFESYITKIIKSRALIGEFQPHRMEGGKRVPVGEPIPDYFPRVLSDEEFALLQDLISERGRRAGGNRGRSFSNLFTGLVRCGYCGGSMVFVDKGEDKRGNRDNRGNRFLVCSKVKRGAGCHYVPWTYADFEEAFFKYAKQVDFERFVASSNDRGQELRNINDELIVVRAKQADITTRRDRLVDALAGGEQQPTAVLDKIIALEDEIDGCRAKAQLLEAQQASLMSRQQASTEAVEALRKVADSLADKQGDELFLFRSKVNEYMRRMLDRIILFPGGTLHTPEEAGRIKGELLASGRHTPEDVENYVAAFLHTSPHKHDRYFAIKNRERIIQAISPEHRVPDMIALLLSKQDLWVEAMQRARAKFTATMGTDARLHGQQPGGTSYDAPREA